MSPLAILLCMSFFKLAFAWFFNFLLESNISISFEVFLFFYILAFSSLAILGYNSLGLVDATLNLMACALLVKSLKVVGIAPAMLIIKAEIPVVSNTNLTYTFIYILAKSIRISLISGLFGWAFSS